MTTFIELFVAGLAVGSVYALIALGFVIIYRASGVMNFAQPEFLPIGAFLAVTLISAGLPWALGVAGAVMITGVLALGVERVVLRPLIGRTVVVAIIATLIVSMLIRIVILLIWGTYPKGMPTPWDRQSTVDVFGTTILYNSIAAVVVGMLVLTLFILFIRYTRIGLGMRASASDQEMAMAVGINVGRVFGLTWFVAGAFAAIAGIFLAMFPRQVDLNLSVLAWRALPAVLVGGVDSMAGAVIAGLALGVLELMAQGYINPRLGEFGENFHTIFTYIIMILFLVFRPHGIFGRAEVRRL